MKKFDFRKYLTENKFSIGMNEASQDDKYTHIGYGKYKEKGKEKDTNAQTFTKDGDKYVPAGNAKEKGGDDSPDETPKVNIFDKPDKEKNAKPKGDNGQEKEPELPFPEKGKDKVLKQKHKQKWSYEDFNKDHDAFTDYVMDRLDGSDDRREIRKDWEAQYKSKGAEKDWNKFLLKKANERENEKGGINPNDDVGEKSTGETGISSTKLKDLMPNADADAFSGKSDIGKINKKQQREISMKIDKLAELSQQARAAGKNPPNYNLCDITVPGTNLYCDGNKGIKREDMPQFKGKPEAGSPADKLPKDDKGEVDTEPIFKNMLKKKGIKTELTSIPSDSLKATQTELVGAKVAGMTKALEKDPNHPGITAPIYVSRDGYVIDGHHRWAAITSMAIKNGKPAKMDVIVIDADNEDVINTSNKFAQDMGIAAKKAAPTDANQEPTKDSTKQRAGHPQTNKEVRSMIKKSGITPQKLGSKKYKKSMVQTAVSALVDSNFSKEARELIAKIENKPEFANDPMKTQPEGGFSNPKYAEWKKNSVFGSEYYNPEDDVDELGRDISGKADWDGEEAIDAISFDLKMNGFKELASQMQSIFENTKKSISLKGILGESILASKEIAHYTGTRESAVTDFIETHNINGDKLAAFVRKGKMKERMMIVSAIAGKPGNKIQKMIISKFGNTNEIALKESARSISQIAGEISRDWKNVNYAAKPYLQAMFSMDKITDTYGMDSGRGIVVRFLSNASQWRGETAKDIKTELKKMLK